MNSKYECFKVPAHGGEAAGELNRFLAGHRIVSVEKQFVPDGVSSCWCFCVHYQTQGSAASSPASAPMAVAESPSRNGGRERPDYKLILDPETFTIFARLREIRKTLSERDGVPVYTIASNEQLAEIARNRVRSLADLGKIEGIGRHRLEKFGEELIGWETETEEATAS